MLYSLLDSFSGVYADLLGIAPSQWNYFKSAVIEHKNNDPINAAMDAAAAFWIMNE